jgi:methionyl aminopeptidase
MYIAGTPSVLAKRLVDTTFEAMMCGIRAVRPGATLGDIGHVIQQHAEAAGFSIVREYCGHGIGKIYHDEPQVLHYGKPGTGLTLKKGMTFTIEPMVNAGKAQTRQLPDGWTVVTKDHSLSAQWEHTLVVTDDGYEILTPWPDA